MIIINIINKINLNIDKIIKAIKGYDKYLIKRGDLEKRRACLEISDLGHRLKNKSVKDFYKKKAKIIENTKEED